MKTILTFCIALLAFSGLYAQTTQADANDNKVFTIVQQKPEFQGDINTWLSNNLVYPKQAIDSNIQGTVYVSFIVERDGSVSGTKVIRGVNNLLDNESIRVVSIMPKWTPGMQNGQTVRVQYMIPIHFTLNGNPANKTSK